MTSNVRDQAAMPSLGPLFVRALFKQPPPGQAQVAGFSIRVPALRQDAARLDAYRRVCGYADAGAVPATWLHVLAFPLHFQLLAARESRLRLIGMVHVANRLRLLRPVFVDEVLSVSVQAQNLRAHSRGVTVDLVSHVRSGDEPVWEGTSVYLVPGAKVPGDPVPIPRTEVPPHASAETWELPADLGRRYRDVAGDPNPIHTHALAARAFGFARPIIHGMWTHARLLAAMDAELPGSFHTEVSFLRPILLPNKVGAWWQREADGWTAAVTTPDAALPYLSATVRE